MAFQIATEKSQGRTIVTVPIHPDFSVSLRAARAAGVIGEEVFVGKLGGGETRTGRSKKYAVLAGVNEPKKSCHGVRKTRAETAAYTAKAKRDRLGASGMEKLVSFDASQNENIGDFLPSRSQNATVTPISSFQEKV
jgi:hypothetical protein